MANALPKIINNDPESVSVNTAADTTASTEFSFVHNSSGNDFSIGGTSAELSPYGTSGSGTYTINKNGRYTLLTNGTVEISQNGGTNFITLNPSGAFTGSVFLKSGNLVRFGSVGNIVGARESYLDALFIIESSKLIGGDRYTKSDYIKIS